MPSDPQARRARASAGPPQIPAPLPASAHRSRKARVGQRRAQPATATTPQRHHKCRSHHAAEPRQKHLQQHEHPQPERSDWPSRASPPRAQPTVLRPARSIHKTAATPKDSRHRLLGLLKGSGISSPNTSAHATPTRELDAALSEQRRRRHKSSHGLGFGTSSRHKCGTPPTPCQPHLKPQPRNQQTSITPHPQISDPAITFPPPTHPTPPHPIRTAATRQPRLQPHRAQPEVLSRIQAQADGPASNQTVQVARTQAATDPTPAAPPTQPPKGSHHQPASTRNPPSPTPKRAD